MTGQVLILGASGKIGAHSAKAFAEAGWTVRLFDRAKDDMIEAAKGCNVIVNGMNPPNYHDWETIIPRVTEQVIAAAKASGATVIVPGNVYHFGDQGGEWSEQTPPRPNSRKGTIRLAMERTYADSGVQTIVLRAGNFIDPQRQNCPMSAIYLREVHRDRITLPGPADTRQAMCYLPDWARACVELAEKRDRLKMFEDIPFPGHTLTANDIKTCVERITDRTMKFTQFPWRLFRITAPFWELARELNEMRYLWNTDHSLSDTRLKHLLPNFEPTPIDEVLRQSLPQ